MADDAAFGGVCTQCRYEGKGKKPGSSWIELVLWLSFLLPGLIYSLWRGNHKSVVCPKCGGKTIIPVDTERAAEILGIQRQSELISKQTARKKEHFLAVAIVLIIITGLFFLGS